MVADVSSLVDSERGLISRRIFIEREIYEQELEQIFARCWLFLCDFRISESNHRGFHGHWAQMMAAESWADLPRVPR